MGVQSQPQPHNKFKNSLGYIRPCFKNKYMHAYIQSYMHIYSEYIHTSMTMKDRIHIGIDGVVGKQGILIPKSCVFGKAPYLEIPIY